MPPPPPPPAPSSGPSAGPPEAGADKRSEKSYFASAVDSINPWTASRSTTPTPKDNAAPRSTTKPSTARSTSAKKADDHSVNTLYGQSIRKYPSDCPPLNVMWFHAVDVPKRKPHFLRTKKENENPTAKPTPPKKFVAFSDKDSRRIENSYQKLLEDVEDERGQLLANKHMRNESLRSRKMSLEGAPNTSIDDDTSTRQDAMRVPVNEDFLFDVDIEQRELAPVYWLGSVYDIRRGSWFYQEGSSLRPCEENLASQLEEGYLKTRPWTYPVNRGRSNSTVIGKEVTPKQSADNLRAVSKTKTGGSLKAAPTPAEQFQPQTYRLFGTYMNSVATYENHNTAWLSSEGVFSWVTSTVYQKFAGGSYMNGVKLVRGYTDPGKTKDGKGTSTPTTAAGSQIPGDDKDAKALKRRSAPAAPGSETPSIKQETGEEPIEEVETQESRLQRQFSSYIENADDPDKQQETIRKREEQEIQDDYTAQDGETQGREIEHLVLVTHGIGQLLGMRMESVNFVHDVNLLRKTMKGVYAHSADLKALNSESGDGPGNCKVQVLPVCWRHLLDFPKRRKKGERDIGDVFADDEEYPSLEDITIEGVAFARSLISDLALDVLLYQSAYREQIAEIVLKESNRIHKLFRGRNPDFKGKVHIVGHSLGSAIMFDILCRQREPPKSENLRNPLRFLPPQDRAEQAKESRDLAFEFSVDDFFCLGSPIGLFQMLKGRTVSARQQPHAVPSESPLNSDHLDDPFRTASAADQHISPITGLPLTISSPKVSQLFNVFHPSDPIAYRVEPLISPAMSSLKPQALPYTKKGMFGAVAPQGLSGIGVKVGQSVSGLWSSFSAGIASSLLNRSLGLSSEDVANFNAANPTAAAGPAVPPNTSGGNNTSTPSPASNPNNDMASGGALTDANAQSAKTDARKRALARQKSLRSSDSSSIAAKDGATGLDTRSAATGGRTQADDEDGANATLIDDELETLYAKFQKKRVEEHKRDGSGSARDKTKSSSASAAAQDFGEAWAAEELKAQKLRREELKVRALNRNGRVDYSIQESALDFNPINTIASHLQYWQDEDVSHFIVSQLLSHKGRKSNETAPTTGSGSTAAGSGLDSKPLC